MTATTIPPIHPSANGHADMPTRSEAGAPQPGRTANGRFAKGNSGGPGNPFARQVAAMRQAFFAAATPEDITKIAQAMIEKAKEGDVVAARLVLQYTLGKPAEAVDPDRLDELEWEQWQREQASHESDKVWTGMHASTANTIARTIVPVMQKEHFKELYEQLQEREEERREDEAEEGEEVTVPQPEASAKSQAAKPRGGEPAEAQGAPTMAFIEAHKAEQEGQCGATESRDSAIDWVLRMLDTTVTKREETEGHAARDTANGDGQRG